MNPCKNSCRRDPCCGETDRTSVNFRPYSSPMSPPGCGRPDRMRERNGGRYFQKEGQCLNELPLAMAYVPLQRWQDIYQADEGFQRGTIFQELDLPFTGRRPC